MSLMSIIFLPEEINFTQLLMSHIIVYEINIDGDNEKVKTLNNYEIKVNTP